MFMEQSDMFILCWFLSLLLLLLLLEIVANRDDDKEEATKNEVLGATS